MSLLVSLLQKPEVLSNAKKTIQDYIRKMKDQKELREADRNPDLLAIRDTYKERKGYHS